VLELIDTHAHIGFDSYDEDRDAMLARAYNAGVKKILHPCCNLEEIAQLETLVQKYNGGDSINVFMAVGLHPTELDKWQEDSHEVLDAYLAKNLATNSKIKAIGETGLDYYHCQEQEQQTKQKDIFIKQIKLAQKYQLPIIVHTRDAWQDTLEILQEYYKEDTNAHNGVLHCFTGDLDFAQACIKLGFYVSWSGVISYKKNDNFRSIAPQLDINRILVETDSPFLSPQAHRGKRNEPSFVADVAEVVAQCYQQPLSSIAKITTANAQRLFKF